MNTSTQVYSTIHTYIYAYITIDKGFPLTRDFRKTNPSHDGLNPAHAPYRRPRKVSLREFHRIAAKEEPSLYSRMLYDIAI